MFSNVAAYLFNPCVEGMHDIRLSLSPYAKQSLLQRIEHIVFGFLKLIPILNRAALYVERKLFFQNKKVELLPTPKLIITPKTASITIQPIIPPNLIQHTLPTPQIIPPESPTNIESPRYQPDLLTKISAVFLTFAMASTTISAYLLWRTESNTTTVTPEPKNDLMPQSTPYVPNPFLPQSSPSDVPHISRAPIFALTFGGAIGIISAFALNHFLKVLKKTLSSQKRPPSIEANTHTSILNRISLSGLLSPRSPKPVVQQEIEKPQIISPRGSNLKVATIVQSPQKAAPSEPQSDLVLHPYSEAQSPSESDQFDSSLTEETQEEINARKEITLKTLNNFLGLLSSHLETLRKMSIESDLWKNIDWKKGFSICIEGSRLAKECLFEKHQIKFESKLKELKTFHQNWMEFLNKKIEVQLQTQHPDACEIHEACIVGHELAQINGNEQFQEKFAEHYDKFFTEDEGKDEKEPAQQDSSTPFLAYFSPPESDKTKKAGRQSDPVRQVQPKSSILKGAGSSAVAQQPKNKKGDLHVKFAGAVHAVIAINKLFDEPFFNKEDIAKCSQFEALNYLHQAANKLFNENNYIAAIEKYQEVLGLANKLDQDHFQLLHCGVEQRAHVVSLKKRIIPFIKILQERLNSAIIVHLDALLSSLEAKIKSQLFIEAAKVCWEGITLAFNSDHHIKFQFIEKFTNHLSQLPKKIIRDRVQQLCEEIAKLENEYLFKAAMKKCQEGLEIITSSDKLIKNKFENEFRDKLPHLKFALAIQSLEANIKEKKFADATNACFTGILLATQFGDAHHDHQYKKKFAQHLNNLPEQDVTRGFDRLSQEIEDLIQGNKLHNEGLDEKELDLGNYPDHVVSEDDIKNAKQKCEEGLLIVQFATSKIKTKFAKIFKEKLRFIEDRERENKVMRYQTQNKKRLSQVINGKN